MKNLISVLATFILLFCSTFMLASPKIYIGKAYTSCTSSKVHVLGAYGTISVNKSQSKYVKLTSANIDWWITISSAKRLKAPSGTNLVKVSRSSSGKITWTFYTELKYLTYRGIKVTKCYASTFKVDSLHGRKTISSKPQWIRIPNYYRKYTYCGSSRKIYPSVPSSSNWVLMQKAGNSIIWYFYKGVPKKYTSNGSGPIVLGGLNFNNTN